MPRCETDLIVNLRSRLMEFQRHALLALTVLLALSVCAQKVVPHTIQSLAANPSALSSDAAASEDSVAARVIVEPSSSRTRVGRIVDSFTINAEYPQVATDGRLAFVTDLTGTLLARNVRTHRFVWRLPRAVSNGVLGAIAADGGKVFFPSSVLSDSVIARDAATGQLVWRSAPLRDLWSDYVVQANGHLYVAGDYGMARLSESNGAIRWVTHGDGPQVKFLRPSIINGVISVNSADLDGHAVNSEQTYNPETGRLISSVSDYELVGHDDKSFFLAATSGTGSLSHDHYVAASISRIGLNGKAFWNWDYHPDPATYARTEDRMANPVLVDKGFVLLDLGDSTYRYGADQEPEEQHPLRLLGLGTPIIVLSDGALFVDDRGLTQILVHGAIARRRRIADFALPSDQFFRDRLSPELGSPIAIVGGAVLAADGERHVIAYDTRLQQARRYTISCPTITDAHITGGVVVFVCSADDKAGIDRRTTVATLVLP